MLVLTIKTDNPIAEISILENDNKVGETIWQADRQLSNQLLLKIDELLNSNNKQLKDLGAIVVSKGPGSFTGLRIGVTVGNTLAYGLGIPIISATGQNWIQKGIGEVAEGKNEKTALPFYGGEPNITLPKK